MSVVGMVKAAVDPMRDRGRGRVVAITSLSVRQPMAELILSNTARAGATGFLKTVARELAGTGVTVNSLQPGLHRTARVTQLYGGDTAATAASATPTTSAASSRSCAASRRSTSPAPRSTSTAARTWCCSSVGG